jgi:hypothetical protein
MRPSREVGFPLGRPMGRLEAGSRCPRNSPQVSPGRTSIVIHLELGAHNVVFVRGKGGGLSWDQGQALIRLERGIWTWSTDSCREGLEFQLLLDDTICERGQPHHLESGHTVHISPDFEWPEIPRVSATVR